jgi:aminomethyltransferase
MPVIYSSISDEHSSTRTNAGVFDISHMGRLRITGSAACGWLDHILTNRVDSLKLGQVRYSLVLNEQGKTLDDVLITRFTDHYLLVVNASNREKLLRVFALTKPTDVTLVDQTYDTAMIACQGPKALDLVRPLIFGADLSSMKYYFAAEVRIADQPGVVSRTGYTGEDGFELIVPSAQAKTIWDRLVQAGAKLAGLGARDTLRLEAGMPLYGHELTESIDPIQAGLAWAVKSAEKSFIGREALSQLDPNRPVRVGLKVNDKRIPREGFYILKDGQQIGTVTSGTASPTLGFPIAMGYVPPAFKQPGTTVEIDIRGQSVPAVVVELPFYRRGT